MTAETYTLEVGAHTRLTDILDAVLADLSVAAGAGLPDPSLSVQWGHLSVRWPLLLTVTQVRHLVAAFGTPTWQSRLMAGDEFLDAFTAVNDRRPSRTVAELWWARPWSKTTPAMVAYLDRTFPPSANPWGDPLPEGWDS